MKQEKHQVQKYKNVYRQIVHAQSTKGKYKKAGKTKHSELHSTEEKYNEGSRQKILITILLKHPE